MLLDQVPSTDGERANAWGELFDMKLWYNISYDTPITEEDILERVIAIRKRNRGLPPLTSTLIAEHKHNNPVSYPELRRYPMLPNECYPVSTVIVEDGIVKLVSIINKR